MDIRGNKEFIDITKEFTRETFDTLLVKAKSNTPYCIEVNGVLVRIVEYWKDKGVLFIFNTKIASHAGIETNTFINKTYNECISELEDIYNKTQIQPLFQLEKKKQI